MKRFLSFLIIIQLLFSGMGSTMAQSRKIDLSLAHEIESSIKLGLRWLVDQQEENGSWQDYPAITALVLSAFLRSHPNISIELIEIARGFDYLKECVQPDGGIYIQHLPNYNTAISLMAFKDANDPKFKEIIINAEKFLMGMQLTEKHGLTPDSVNYGGMGYGDKERPDLSNLQWAIEAIAMDDVIEKNPEAILSEEELERMKRKKLFYDRALVFLAACQNLEGVNRQPYTLNDGGFMYEPGGSKAGGTRSYGSMTYAGLKSLIHAKVDRDDKRVHAAFDWLSRHFTVETNPFMGDQGLYYYYQVMAKTLHAYGQESITDTTGTSYNWRYALADQLLKNQSAEGFWVNENGRWWENNPVLVTAYSILALQEVAGLTEFLKTRNNTNPF